MQRQHCDCLVVIGVLFRAGEPLLHSSVADPGHAAKVTSPLCSEVEKGVRTYDIMPRSNTDVLLVVRAHILILLPMFHARRNEHVWKIRKQEWQAEL